MPFRAARRYLAALTATALALSLQACALSRSDIERFAPPAEPVAEAAPRPVTGPGEIWRVVDQVASGGDLQWLAGASVTSLLQPVAVAALGQFIYIVDAGTRQLLRYDSAIDRITLIRDLKGVLTGDAADLFLHRDMSFYLADPDGARVLHFDADGRLIRVIQDRAILGRPVSVIADENSGYLFIADGFNDDVMVFNPAGLLTGAIGIRGQGPGRFLGITALAQGPDGYYVGTRFGPTRVQLMGYDGAFRESLQANTVTFPTSIAVDADGRVFVADYMSDDIKVYQGSAMIGTIGGHGSAPGRFRRITDLWVDEGFLYVADSLNRRVQILDLASWEPSARLRESSGQ
jgi:DNA-binding beta-propeller fold protein YncE